MLPKTSEKDIEGILVGIRLRPLVPHEHGQPTAVNIEGNTVKLDPPGRKTGNSQLFQVDAPFDSSEPGSANYASQEAVYEACGHRMVGHAFSGYHSTIFAYGQTGTGKTTTIVGSANPPKDRGLLLRLAQGILEEASARRSSGSEVTVQLQMLEVYNERLRDLLAAPQKDKERRQPELHVHPKLGVYVQDASEAVVSSLEECLRLIEFGNTMRTIAATAMNRQSSRSHTTFRFRVESTTSSACTVSDVYVVDLAGRENERTTLVTGDRFSELAFINRSLMWLSQCIQALSSSAGGPPMPMGRSNSISHVQSEPRPVANRNRRFSCAAAPYSMPSLPSPSSASALPSVSEMTSKKPPSMAKFRNSKLTLLLCNALSGNSRTAMIGTLSPAAAHYEESLSTLRFAASVKSIKLKAAPVSSTNKEKMVQEMAGELKRLREQLAEARGGERFDELKKELDDAELLCKRYAQTAAELKQASDLEARKREETLLKLSLARWTMARLHVRGAARSAEPDLPYLANVSDDPFLCRKLFIIVPKRGGEVSVGTAEDCDVSLSGLGLCHRTCILWHSRPGDADDGGLWIRPCPDDDGEVPRLELNGTELGPEPRSLLHGDQLSLGYAYTFVVHTQPGGIAGSLAQTPAITPTSSMAWQSEATLSTELIRAVIGKSRARDSKEITAARDFCAQLQRRRRELDPQPEASDVVLKAFLRNAKRANELVAEANTIMEEMGEAGLSFQLVAEAPVLSFGFGTTGLPTLAVRLSRATPKSRLLWRSAIRQVTERREGLAGALQQLEQIGIGSGEEAEVLCLWSFTKFEARLQLMRDFYEVWHEGASLEELQLPWSDASAAEVAELRRGLQDAQERLLVARDELQMQRKRSSGYEAAQDRTVRELDAAHEELRAQAAEIQRLKGVEQNHRQKADYSWQLLEAQATESKELRAEVDRLREEKKALEAELDSMRGQPVVRSAPVTSDLLESNVDYSVEPSEAISCTTASILRCQALAAKNRQLVEMLSRATET
mmetsp:Transcript_2589/g.6011  ORF Transcript_2589/g.6011 Transcript_2589/m.6011 type:complete len:1014 (-) Transcript_2589:205-3246(-)